MENLIYQYIYLSKILKNPNIKIDGKVKIDKQSKLINKLKKLFIKLDV